MHQPNITMYQGDTMEVTVEITEIADGEERPWTPTNETVMLSVGNPRNPIFQRPVVDGVARIEHEDTQTMMPNNYKFDVRVYDPNYNLVATPIIGDFVLLDVINRELLQP